MSGRGFFERARGHEGPKTFLDGPRELRYGALITRVAKAHAAFSAAGIGPLDRVLIASEDDESMIVTLLAGLHGACVPVFADPSDPAPRLAELARRCNAKAIIFDAPRSDSFAADALGFPSTMWRVERRAQPRLVERLLGRSKSKASEREGTFAAAVDAHEPADELRDRSETDEAYVMCTSGSTARPKCVSISRGALRSHLDTLEAVFAYAPDSRTLNILPLHHADGLIHGALQTFYSAGTLLRPFVFSMARVQELVDHVYRMRVTHMVAVPTMYSLIESMGEAFEATFGDPGLVATVSTAGPLDPALAARWKRRSGKILSNVYGLTETVVGACFNGPAPQDHRPGSVGRALDCEFEIRSEDGEVLGPARPGEIWIRGANLMSGYLDDEELTQASMVEGWLRTGDLGELDVDGYCFIRGRRDEMIICAGENISPLELESALRDVPGVHDAVVLGSPDPHFGEVPVALIEPTPSTIGVPVVTKAQIVDALATRLSPQKQPRGLTLVEKLPRGPTGKVKRREAFALLPTASESQNKHPDAPIEIQRIASEVFNYPLEKIVSHDGPDSIPGWDSLGHMQLVAAIERNFGLRLSTAEIISIRRLRDLESMVAEPCS